MVIYERTKKVLVIPEGLDGGGHSGSDYERGVADGKAAQKIIDDNKITPTTAITENGSYTAPYGFKEVVVNVPTSGGSDCSSAITEAYQSGYSEGVNAVRNQFTSTAITRNGTYEMTGEFNAFSSVTVNVPKEVRLGTLVDTPLPNDLTSDNYYNRQFQSAGTSVDGWGTLKLNMGSIIAYGKRQQRDLMSSTTITQNGTYTRTNGWNEVIVDVPTSGVTPGELSSIYIDVAIIGGMIGAPSREITCNGYTYDTTGRRGYDLLATGHIFIVRTGTLPERYITPTSVTFTVTNSEFGEWEQNGWSINEVKFNGLVDEYISSYTGGFSYTPTSTTTEVADEGHMRIIITL